LERWYRDHLALARYDISSSGVEAYSFGDFRQITGLEQAELDALTLCDGISAGGAELRRAIATRWGNGDPERVIVTHGSSEAIFLFMATTVERGDHIVVLDPMYHSLVSVAASTGCEISRWPLLPGASYEFDLDGLGALLRPSTRMVVVNTPHNPTGATLTSRQQAELVDAAASVGAYLVWDAAFSDLVFEGDALLDPSLDYELTTSFGTLSKAYGLPGLRLGWCMSDSAALARCISLRDSLTLFLSPLIERLALAAVEHADALLAPRKRQARENLALLEAWADGERAHVEWSHPKGGVCAFPRLLDVEDVEVFCLELLDRYATLLVPGAVFGVPDRVRLGFGERSNEFKEGLELLSEFMQERDRPGGPVRSAGGSSAGASTEATVVGGAQGVPRLVLSETEVEEIALLLDEVVSEHTSVEEPGFLELVRTYAQELPRRVRHFLNSFALHEPAGACVIAGYPVDDDAIGPTPSHWRERIRNSPAVREEILLALYGSILGEIFGWATQQDGTVIHEVVPIREHEKEQLGSGSKQLLWWHTEDAFHPYRGDYLGLLCLRNPSQVATTFASADMLSINEHDVEILFQSRFTIRPDESHLPKNNSGENGSPFSSIEEMRDRPEQIAVMFGSRETPYLRLDPYFMDEPQGEGAQAAFDTLVKEIDRQLIDVVLEPGECLFVDNYRAVHGRVPFTARFDGTDRWLKRVNVTRDLRKSRAARTAAADRLITSDAR
jgi:L-asparagine oxygenase